jgi:predicted dinucleotide-binding enzyme
MRIGVIGSGNMGRAIGVRLAGLGHDVMFGARGPEGNEAAQRAGHGARAGSNDEAAEHGELLVWTIRDTDPRAVLTQPAHLAGKIVVNINNRDYAQDVKGGAWFGRAIAEEFQAQAPGAIVVKALNTVAMEALDTSADALREAGAQAFIAGDDAAAKRIVANLLAAMGFEAVDVGAGPVALRAVEALGDVIRLLMIDGGRGGRANLQLRMLPPPDLGVVGARAESKYH